MPSVKDQVNFQSRFNINANGENKLKGGTLDRNGGSKGTGILISGGSNPIPGAEFVNLGYDGLNQKDIELQVEMKRKYDAELVAYDFR